MFVKAYLLFRDLRFDLRFAHHCRLLRQQAACRQPAAGEIFYRRTLPDSLILMSLDMNIICLFVSGYCG